MGRVSLMTTQLFCQPRDLQPILHLAVKSWRGLCTARSKLSPGVRKPLPYQPAENSPYLPRSPQSRALVSPMSAGGKSIQHARLLKELLSSRLHSTLSLDFA